MQQPSLDGADPANRDQTHSGGGLRFDAKRKHRRGKDKERASALVDSLEKDTEQYHPADVHDWIRVLQKEQTEVQEEKYDRARDIQKPQLEAHVVDDGLDKKETEIEDPKQRAPSVVFVANHGPPRPKSQPAVAVARLNMFESEQWHASILAPPVNFGHCAAGDEP